MLEIGAIVWDVQDLHRAIKFWSDALDYKLAGEPDGDIAGDQAREQHGSISETKVKW
jgi:hypothetical protein